ncbi:MAG TPA: hypothetical protein VNZ26_10750 [Vicinamibacterales bacterium]|nr:hypothetical protein [Vicinamibacterales bacterium]
MFKSAALLSVLSVLVVPFLTADVMVAHAEQQDRTLAVIMTNDSVANEVKVYDAGSGNLLQTLATHGKGGVSGNARGVKQYKGQLFAAVNNGSNTVAVFRRDDNELTLDKVVATTSAPVSVDFANGHMYVAGATTVDSFPLQGNRVGALDGTTGLELAGGGTPGAGSTAQVGAVNDQQLLVTIKTDPTPGTVDIVALHDGAITGAQPTAASAPTGSLTPFGFSVYPDGSAIITLAHSNQDGLFVNGAFAAVVGAGQLADCWMTRVGKYVFTANTASKTLSRLIGTGEHIFVDDLVAATVTTGGNPSDLDAANGVLGVIDGGAGPSHLSLFTYDRFGGLTARGTPIDLTTQTANGVAIIPPSDDSER